MRVSVFRGRVVGLVVLAWLAAGCVQPRQKLPGQDGGQGGTGGGSDGSCGSATDPKNCGSCGHDCTGLPNVAPGAAGVECHSGVCSVPPAACVSGYGHCSSRADDGCEAHLVDAQSCGACGTKCSGATPLCTSSSTGPKCSATCAAPSPDTCGTSCVSLASDPKNCGTCGHDCGALPNVAAGAAGLECRAGVCYVPPAACATGYAHCSSRSDDGCEASLTDAQSCGGCGHACAAPTPLCGTTGSASACIASCSGTAPDACGAMCVNLTSDPKNCGACGHDCASLPGVKAGATGIQCMNKQCYIPPAACTSGLGHCSSKPDDGCETDLGQPDNCGSCGMKCSAPTALCSNTTGTPTCSSSCMAPLPNLCGSKCVDLSSDPANCGTCGHDCTMLSNIKTGATGITCMAGTCNVPASACVSGFAHCSTRADDGCETNITLPANCGGCGHACSAPTALCSSSTGTPTCSSSCVAPAPDLCTSKCVDLSSDPNNCGACGHDCTTLPNVKPGATGIRCVSRVCSIPAAACVSG